MKNNNKLKNLASFLFESGTLRKTARAHRQTLLTDDLSDNIAAHSYRVTLIGWFLAKEERADVYKVITMCLFHDLPEARGGDQNWVHKRYIKVYDDEIIKDQASGLPNETEFLAISNEYQERKTKEAIIAKDADLLEQVLLLKEIAWAGNNEAQHWLGNGSKNKNEQIVRLQTKTARRLAEEIMKQNPGDWWKHIWTEKRR